MALPKTVSYVPFEETSFGYGSTELATNYATEFPNGTDIVKIIIEHSSGNWDTTGHLSTPSSGTAVAVYNAAQEQLTIKGERDDVDAVLAELSFFPADKEETRTWTPTQWKVNQTTGNYADEEPPAIGDTVFSLKAYNASDVLQVTGDVTFEVTEAVFGNQRPYWTANPSTEDLTSAAHGTVAGGLVDFGTISHGSDTENVQVKCEFRHYGFSNYTTGNLGTFTLDDGIYIGDKKPSTTNNTDSRFNFTGSVSEAQAFLDNVRYYDSDNAKTFDMFLTISDGVVGSYATKTVYFSSNVLTVSTVPDVHYVEDDNPAYWDFGNLNFNYANMPEVNTFTATITLDATGRVGCSTFDTSITVDTDSYDSGTGVLTITDDNILVLTAALRNLRFTPVADFNSAFTMTVDFTFSNPTVGSSYSAAQQTLNVTAEEKSEVSNLTTTHTWTEDQWYDFPVTNIPQIIHGRNDDFDIVFTLSDTNAGVLWRHGNDGFYRVFGSGYKLSGTRDEVNAALALLYFTPTADYDSDFTISFTVDRTSGDLTNETQSVGSMIMNAIAASEISFPLVRPEITWRNNISNDFVSGLQITDTADTIAGSPIFESTYTVKMLLRQLVNSFSGVQMETGVLKINNDYIELLDTVTGNYSNFLTITGSKDVVNFVLRNLTFIPDPLYAEDNSHYVVYEVTRDADTKIIQNYTSSILTWIRDALINQDGYSYNTQLFDWTEDTPFEFDSQLKITETPADNEDYTSANGYDDYYASNYQVKVFPTYGAGSLDIEELNFTSTNIGAATMTGSGTYSDMLTITGSKADCNTALENLKMTPTSPDFTGVSGETNFRLEASIKRLNDGVFIHNRSHPISTFNNATQVDNYLETWTNVEYIEDIQAQYIFSHLSNFINDGGGDLFPTATYDVSVRLANETTGKFEAYVDEGYLLDDELSIFVNDYEVRIVGSKADVNTAIQNLQFTPYADVNTNVDIHYTQKRTYNNTTVTHANDVVVTTMIGIDTPEFVYGTANNNIQYFVADEFRNGVDTTKTKEDITNGLADVVLTPKQISANLGLPYDAPITVTDTFEDTGPSLYKITFDGGTLFTPLNASLNITDTGWQTKSELNNILKNGIYPTNVIESHPVPVDENEVQSNNFTVNSDGTTHDVQYTVNFELLRRSASGVDAVIKSGSLTYQFKTGLQLWSYEREVYYDTSNITTVSRRLDKNSLYGVKKLNVYFGQVTKETDGYYVDTSPVSWDAVSDNLEVTDGIASNRAGNTTPLFDVHFALYRYINEERESITQSAESIYQVGNRFIIEQATKRPVGGQDYSSSTGRWLLPIQIERSQLQFETTFELKAWTDWGVQLKQGSPSDPLILRSIYGPNAGDSYGGNINR